MSNKDMIHFHQSKICYDLNCDNNTIPFLYCFLFFSIGLGLSWFVFDYITINSFYQGIYLNLCINGFHIHHLYFGIVILLITPFFVIIKNRKYGLLIFSFSFGLGLGLIMSDIFIHFVLDIVVFNIRCE